MEKNQQEIEVNRHKMHLRMNKEQHDSINLSHYASGSGRLILPKEVAQKFRGANPNFELWVVNSKEELYSLIDGGEVESLKRVPFLLLVPFEEPKEE